MKLKRYNVRGFLTYFGIALLFAGMACKQGPNTGDPIPLETEASMSDVHRDVVMDLRKITVVEAVPTSKYLYLKVAEDGREYWMATSPSQVKPGEVYYYNEALIRADFESKEMERVFDTIYLVTRIVPEAKVESLRPVKSIAIPDPEASGSEGSEMGTAESQDATPVKIASVLDDPASFEGKWVEISGTCTKVNEGILNRNWIHIKDGSADDRDFVVTSSASVKPGDPVKMKAVVRLDKDFGAGYSYAILLEDGVVVE
jgi:hypothetical protein